MDNMSDEFGIPDTVTVLEQPRDDCDNSRPPGKAYIVGTAHFSEISQNDVKKTIEHVNPDIVMVELCSARVGILSLDEETVLREAKNLSMEKMTSTIRESGIVQGIMHIMLLSLSAHITKQLGMAPGGEFRTAFDEAKKIPGCRLSLGDRPIHVTLQRALGSLSVWQKLKLVYCIMMSKKETITKEDVEKCKKKDLLEVMLKEMAGEFPQLSEIFVTERDLFMTYQLRKLLKTERLPPQVNNDSSDDDQTESRPMVIVAVVGMGHVAGISSNWENVLLRTDTELNYLMQVPQPSLAWKVTRMATRGAFYGAAAYLLYKVSRSAYRKFSPV